MNKYLYALLSTLIVVSTAAYSDAQKAVKVDLHLPDGKQYAEGVYYDYIYDNGGRESQAVGTVSSFQMYPDPYDRGLDMSRIHAVEVTKINVGGQDITPTGDCKAKTSVAKDSGVTTDQTILITVKQTENGEKVATCEVGYGQGKKHLKK